MAANLKYDQLQHIFPCIYYPCIFQQHFWRGLRCLLVPCFTSVSECEWGQGGHQLLLITVLTLCEFWRVNHRYRILQSPGAVVKLIRVVRRSKAFTRNRSFIFWNQGEQGFSGGFWVLTQTTWGPSAPNFVTWPSVKILWPLFYYLTFNCNLWGPISCLNK